MRALRPKVAEKIAKRYKIKQNGKSTHDVEKEIVEEIKREKIEQLKNKLNSFSRSNSEKVNSAGIWKYLKNIDPKISNSLPCAKYNHMNELISEPLELKKTTLKGIC